MKVMNKSVEHMTLKPLMYLELLIASAMPVVAILLVSVVGTNQMTSGHPNPGFFIGVFFLCAIATFFGEVLIILFIQRAIKGQLSDLVNVCQDFIAGNKGRRAIALGDDELATLVHTVNGLLDYVNRSSQTERRERVQEANLLSTQMQRLHQELNPLTRGDLRIQISLPEGSVGLVAGICNGLIEELIYFIRLTRSASEQVISAAYNSLSRSVELAQAAETLLLRVAQMAEISEKLIALAQRIRIVTQQKSDTAQISQRHGAVVHTMPESRRRNQEQENQAYDMRPVLDSQDHEQPQQDRADMIEEMLELAESLTNDLETFAQQLHLSSTKVLQAAEVTGTLITFAEEWKGSTEHILLP